MLWYATDSNPNDWVPLKLDQVNEILEANKNGEFPDDLGEFRFEEQKKEKAEALVADFVGGNAEDSITRFDMPRKRRNRNRKGNRNRNRKGGSKAQDNK